VGPHAAPAALRRAARAALAALLVAFYARGFVLELRRVASGSMEPTLLTGDHLLVDRMVYAGRDLPPAIAALLPVREPRRGDLVAARSPEDRRRVLLKRCTALAGDPVPAGAVPPATLWVEGDRRGDSRDSRAFGPVERRDLVGRGVLVVVSRSADGWRPGRTLRPVR
jgi:signal peptidase I